jgi:uncharacterized membrane protein YhaH (DUF805 family)
MHGDPSQAMGFLAFIFAFYALFILLILTAIIIPSWFICKKAGFSPWLAFLNIIPVGGLILMYILAFADWKVVPIEQVAWGPRPPFPPPYPPYPPQVPPPPQAPPQG